MTLESPGFYNLNLTYLKYFNVVLNFGFNLIYIKMWINQYNYVIVIETEVCFDETIVYVDRLSRYDWTYGAARVEKLRS